jgi:hypothetical protein
LICAVAAEQFPQLLLWEFLHSDKQTALLPSASRPTIDQVVQLSPPAKVEIPDAKIGSK